MSVAALIDVCVLVAAHRTDHPHHERARIALDEEARDGFLWCSHTRNGFLRLVTHSRVFPQPTPITLAVAAWQAWCERPHSRLLVESAASANQVARLCRERQAMGNAIYDLHLAALALADGCALWSFDQDFARLASLRFKAI